MVFPEFVGFQVRKNWNTLSLSLVDFETARHLGRVQTNPLTTLESKCFSLVSSQTEHRFCQVRKCSKSLLTRLMLEVWISHWWWKSWNITYWLFMSPASELNRQNTEQKIAWNERLKLSPSTCFSQTFSFGLEHFERIIKSPLFGSILEVRFRVYWATKILQQVIKCRIPIIRAMISATQVLCRRPSIHMTSDPDHSKNKTREESFGKFLWR